MSRRKRAMSTIAYLIGFGLVAMVMHEFFHLAVDADGNVFVAEGPASLADAGSAFTKYQVAER